MNNNISVVFFFLAMSVSLPVFAEAPKHLDVVSVIPQNEIGAWLETTHFSGVVGFIMSGGLGAVLGGISDAKQNSDAIRVEGDGTLVDKYRHGLDGFDFRGMMNKTIQSSLDQSAGIRLSDYSVSDSLQDFRASFERKDVLLKKKQLLRLKTFYFFDADFNVIYIKTTGRLYFGNKRSSRIKRKDFLVIYQSPAKEVYYKDPDFNQYEKEVSLINDKYEEKIFADRKNKKRFLREKKEDLEKLVNSKPCAERKILIKKKYAEKIFFDKEHQDVYEHKMEKELKRLMEKATCSEQADLKRVGVESKLSKEELASKTAVIKAKYKKKIAEDPGNKKVYERAGNRAIKRLNSETLSLRSAKRENDWSAEEMRSVLALGAQKVSEKILYFIMNDVKPKELSDRQTVKMIYEDGLHLSEPDAVVVYEVAADDKYSAYFLGGYGKNNLYISPKKEPILYPK